MQFCVCHSYSNRERPMKRTLVFLPIATLLAFFNPAFAQIDGQIAFTTSPPNIDGLDKDAAWSNATAYDNFFVAADVEPDDPSDLFATWKGLWDTDALYLYTTVVDDTLINADDNDWKDDSIEFYVDVLGLGQGDSPELTDYNTEGAGQPVFQLTFVAEDEQITNGINHNEWVARRGDNNEINGDGWLVAEGFYAFEIELPWSALGGGPAEIFENGGTFGFGLAVNDDDDTGPRDSQLMWATENGDLWNNAASFPLVELVAPTQATDGDFDDDGNYSCEDVDALTEAIASGGNNSDFDLTEDGSVNIDDLDAWRAEAGTALGHTGDVLNGDANLDGVVDANDLNTVGVNWQQDVDPAAWCSGDFDANRVVDANDLNLVGINWQQSVAAAEPAATVPEPSGLALLVVGLVAAGSRRRM